MVRESFSACEGFENNRPRSGGYRFSLKQRAPESLFFCGCVRVYVCVCVCVSTCRFVSVAYLCFVFMYTIKRDILHI